MSVTTTTATPETDVLLSRQVVRSLGDYIRRSRLEPGDRLPPERDLAVEFGVSRGTVREALKSLEMIGAISRQPGRGSVLRPVDLGFVAEFAQSLLLSTPSDLADLIVVRKLVEVGMLPLVARRAREEHFTQMETALRLMELEIHAEPPTAEGDLAFHMALLTAAGNRFLTQFGSLIHRFFAGLGLDLIVDPNDTSLGAAAAREAASGRPLEEHRAIVRALRAGDVAEAQRVMERHLDRYNQYLDRMAGFGRPRGLEQP